jgi:dynein heavy chain
VEEWQQYYNSKEPHKYTLPEPWHESLNDFEKMIVLRCIRQDKVSDASHTTKNRTHMGIEYKKY